MTTEKARQNWIAAYRLFGKNQPEELTAYQEYISVSQGKKSMQSVYNIPKISCGLEAKTLDLFQEAGQQ